MSDTNRFALLGAGLLGAGLLTAALIFTGGDNAAKADKPVSLAAAAPIAAPASAPVETPAPQMINANEADAWAQARAANTTSAYKVYLAAYPTGAFASEAIDRLATAERPAAAKAPVQRAAAPAPRAVSQSSAAIVAASPAPIAAPMRNIAGECQAYVDQTLSAPSRTVRTVGGAVAGCGAGAMAGGDDGRNCVVGAVIGGAAGAISAESRERRRVREVNQCIANGGPPN
jgi:hypothetical protein